MRAEHSSSSRAPSRGRRFIEYLHWPLHKCTWPNKTPVRFARSPVDATKRMALGLKDGGWGGSRCRHTPLASVVACIVLLLSVVRTNVPGLANPHTIAAFGAHCRTMSSPRVFDSSKVLPSGGAGGGHGGQGG